MESALYRAIVSRIDAGKVYVEVPVLGTNREFGPVATTDGTGFALGDAVLVGRIADVTEDLVILATGAGGGSTVDLTNYVQTTDPRLSDSRAPSGAAGGSLAGTYPNPGIAAGAVDLTAISNAIKDAAAGTASLRTLGTGAQQAAPGNHTHASGSYEPPITAGTTAQYWRGDKTWQTLDKTAVGLNLVDNTSDANKPVSTPQQSALDLKAVVSRLISTGTGLTGGGDLSADRTLSVVFGTTSTTVAAGDHTHAAGVSNFKVVRFATTAGSNLTLSGAGTTIDGGSTTAVGDRILVRSQTNAAQNGIYVVQSGAWTRATDADTAAKINGSVVVATEGTENAGHVFTTTWLPSYTLGSSNMVWERSVTSTTYGNTGQIPIAPSANGAAVWTDPTLSMLVGSWVHESVRAATTVNITLSGLQTVDTVPLNPNDRVLVKDQTTPANNGVYVAGSSTWQRATDFQTSAKHVGAIIAVREGSQAGQRFTTDFKPTDTIGTTAMSWAVMDTKSNFIIARTALYGAPVLSGTQTVNGVALAVGDVVLARDQANAYDNGVYIVQSGAWIRHPQANTSAKIDGLRVLTREGSFWKGYTWTTRWSSITDTLGTTAMAWNYWLLDADIGTTVASLSSGAVPVSQLGNAALSTLGGSEKVLAVANTGTATLDCSQASVFTTSPTGGVTLSPTNVPGSGKACTITVIVNWGNPAYAITMPTGSVWLGTAPAQTVSKKCVITMMTTDNGVSWLSSGVVQA